MPSYTGYHSSFQTRGNMIKLRNKTSLIHTKEQSKDSGEEESKRKQSHQEKAQVHILSQFYYSVFIAN